jgi:hypothetical protein
MGAQRENLTGRWRAAPSYPSPRDLSLAVLGVVAVIRRHRFTAKTLRSPRFRGWVFETEKPDGPVRYVSAVHPAHLFSQFRSAFLAIWRFKIVALCRSCLPFPCHPRSR